MTTFVRTPILLLLLLGTMLLCTSCYVNRHTVGDGPVGRERARVYSSAKQAYLLNGLVAIGTSSPPLPPDGNYQIKTSMNIVDMFVYSLTFSIVSLRTIKIRVRTDSPDLKSSRSHRNWQKSNNPPADSTQTR
jgi:hypothetical protein